ncbi:ferredoxin [uncultured Selenomonas sp.]|uniref:ferredoxin n=1 Tax=uncultured Selenomonas sp. TaxID=159275 RepID=UPI0025F4A3EA|nr:ferredoxin [uncultured Selenomonas sp.]
MKATVDKSLCVACGACAGTCPWVFRMGADGLAEAYGEIEKTELDAAQDAAQDCPVGAIKIE